MGALAVFLCSPLAIAIARYATEHEATPERLFKTKYLAVRWHAASSLAMAIGIWLDPWFPWVWTRVPGAALGLAY